MGQFSLHLPLSNQVARLKGEKVEGSTPPTTAKVGIDIDSSHCNKTVKQTHLLKHYNSRILLYLIKNSAVYKKTIIGVQFIKAFIVITVHIAFCDMLYISMLSRLLFPCHAVCILYLLHIYGGGTGTYLW
jgi:hypothetical protein